MASISFKNKNQNNYIIISRKADFVKKKNAQALVFPLERDKRSQKITLDRSF